MARDVLPSATLLGILLMNPLTLRSQRVPLRPDSAQLAQGRALCGRLADDSVGFSPFSLPAGSLVSPEFPGLEPPSQVGFGPALEYPDHLRKRGIQGRVVVSAVIDTTGRVERGSVKVVTTPHEDFVPAVERFLMRARYQPGKLYGRPMRVCIVMPIDFFVPGR